MNVSVDAQAILNVAFSARLQEISGVEPGPVVAAQARAATLGVVHANGSEGGGSGHVCKLTVTFTTLLVSPPRAGGRGVGSFRTA